MGNLLDNAIDAAAGRRRSRAGSGSGPGAPRGLRAAEPGLQLRVADSGPGLDRTRPRGLFQRGYSTKPTDRVLGRGIGLALVAQAAHRYGGCVDVSNETGAVFTVSLRRSTDPADGRARRAIPVAGD